MEPVVMLGRHISNHIVLEFKFCKVRHLSESIQRLYITVFALHTRTIVHFDLVIYL